jgi:hypothetical protein
MPNSPMKVYVSGPISGLPEEVWKKNFADACERVNANPDMIAVDASAVVPQCENACGSDLTFEDGSYKHLWSCYMKWDIMALLDCDAIYMIPGSENSRGAKLELQVARSLGYWIGTPNDEGGIDW